MTINGIVTHVFCSVDKVDHWKLLLAPWFQSSDWLGLYFTVDKTVIAISLPEQSVQNCFSNRLFSGSEMSLHFNQNSQLVLKDHMK